MHSIKHGAHLAVSRLTHGYSRKAPPVLVDIDLQIEPGESLALIGQSGCGKSTLLHLMAGLARPLQGQVLLDGTPVRGPSPELVMMFQSPSLYPWMSVSQNIGLGLQFTGRRAQITNRVEELLELVQLPGFADRNVQDLSGGQQQRVALARSLAPHPRVLLLDEPFSALDTFTRHSLQRDVRAIARDQKLTLVMVTHDVAEAAQMADRAIVMQANPGRIVSEIAVQPDPREDMPPGQASFDDAAEKIMTVYRTTAGMAAPDTAHPTSQPSKLRAAA